MDEMKAGKSRKKCPCKTQVYIHLRHTHACVELENQCVLLESTRSGTHICVHLRHANVFTWNTHVFTWNTMKRVSNSDAHVCTRGTHVCSPGTQTRAMKAHMCGHVGNTYVYHWNTSMCPTVCATKAHMCAHVEHTREQT